MHNLRAFAAAFALLASNPVLAHDHKHMGHADSAAVMPAEGVMVKAAWSPETPPGAMNAAVYLTLANMSEKAVAVIGAASPDFTMTHIHRTSVTDGMASMQAVEHLEIPPGKAADFEPGGLHIMMMSPVRRIPAGESFPVTLFFDDGTSVEFSVPVVKAVDGAPVSKKAGS